jgi:hypothetical protein
LGIALGGSDAPAQSTGRSPAPAPRVATATNQTPATPPAPQVFYADTGIPAVILVPETLASAPAQPRPAQETVAPQSNHAAPIEESEPQPPLLRRTRLQPGEMRPGEEITEFKIQLEPPGLERVTRRESERNLQQRMIQEARNRPNIERIEFPEEPPLTKAPYEPRAFPPRTKAVEPNYVCYRRLHFEELNSERYGWDLGFIQPFVSAGTFFCDVAFLPYHIGTEPGRHHECSAGYCLPGDPVPYMIYPPKLSLTGTILEAGAIVAGFAIFPG